MSVSKVREAAFAGTQIETIRARNQTPADRHEPIPGLKLRIDCQASLRAGFFRPSLRSFGRLSSVPRAQCCKNQDSLEGCSEA
jgi:hypothetical protein